MQLPGKGRLSDDQPYVNLSKKFKEWNSQITVNQYDDNVSKAFLNWLRPQMNTVNNFGKYVSRLKSVLYWAIDEDKCISPTAVRPSNKIYSAEKEEVRQPYLTGNSGQTDPTCPVETDPFISEQTDPTFPVETDPLFLGK